MIREAAFINAQGVFLMEISSVANINFAENVVSKIL